MDYMSNRMIINPPESSDTVGDAPHLSLRYEYLEGIHLTTEASIIQPEWELRPTVVMGQLKGGTAEVEMEDGGAWRIEDGEGYFLPMGANHRYHFHACGEMEIRNAHLRYRLMNAIDLLPALDLPRTVEPKAGERIGDLCEALLALHAPTVQPSLRLSAQRHEQAFRLLDVVLALAGGEEKILEMTHGLPRLQGVLDFVEANLEQPLRRADLAEIAHLSEPHLHAVFRETLGMAPMTYVKQQRLEKAQLLLFRSDLSVGEAGKHCGYPDPFHFSRTFRGQFGLSPRAYRTRSRRGLAIG
ncbi:MAG: helix-turn-helix domain-containing protein [Planctomycetota bacterium]